MCRLEAAPLYIIRVHFDIRPHCKSAGNDTFKTKPRRIKFIRLEEFPRPIVITGKKYIIQCEETTSPGEKEQIVFEYYPDYDELSLEYKVQGEFYSCV